MLPSPKMGELLPQLRFYAGRVGSTGKTEDAPPLVHVAQSSSDGSRIGIGDGGWRLIVFQMARCPEELQRQEERQEQE